VAASSKDKATVKVDAPPSRICAWSTPPERALNKNKQGKAAVWALLAISKKHSRAMLINCDFDDSLVQRNLRSAPSRHHGILGMATERLTTPSKSAPCPSHKAKCVVAINTWSRFPYSSSARYPLSSIFLFNTLRFGVKEDILSTVENENSACRNKRSRQYAWVECQN